jgi:TPP-dependent 2-oxoacid decarboxylase
MATKLIFHAFDLNPEFVGEKDFGPSLIETTGYERIEKTVDRLMVAGMNLYDYNRGGAYQDSDADIVDGLPPAPSKYYDEKDVKMRMREIQKRLKRMVNREGLADVVDSQSQEPATAEPAAAEPVAKPPVKEGD